MTEFMPPNTHDLNVQVRVTLPPGESPDQQDITLLLTGEEWSPWPGVQIHDLRLLAHWPAESHPTPGRDDLSTWFELSYASFLTLPRVLMEAMPDHWQRRMAALLNEYDETFERFEGLSSMVVFKSGRKFIKAPHWLLNYRHPDQAAIERQRVPREAEHG